MHLDKRHGETIESVREAKWRIDAVVDWADGPRPVAVGDAIANLARTFAKLKPDIVLIVGDRVEAFAAAAAGHLSDVVVAHVHGGDRALGQMDDSLRHAISKLSHVHFPATRESAARLKKMGEDGWRIHRVGSPGIDNIRGAAAGRAEIRKIFPSIQARRFALMVLHPTEADEGVEFRRARLVADAVRKSMPGHIVVIYPNNDPGSAGIIRCWQSIAGDTRFTIRADVSRPIFLGLLRDAAMLVGNSSAGIIEAGSFGTPVIDIGPRQRGRERCKDVRNVPQRGSAIAEAVRNIWNGGRPRRGKCANPYSGKEAGVRMAGVLGSMKIDRRLLRKIISY
jgi:GDP/UDP-N,N'-diacetylbacillosamine 2-epimerase (hydrolysing)